METSRESRIRERAYQIWKDDGEPHGQDHTHWARATAEIEAQIPGDAGLVKEAPPKAARKTTVKKAGTASAKPTATAQAAKASNTASAATSADVKTEPAAKSKTKSTTRSRPARKV